MSVAKGVESDGSPSLSSRLPSNSIQASATVNAGLQHAEPTRRFSSSSLSRNQHSTTAGCLRSQILINFQMADPAISAPGDMDFDGHQPMSLQRTVSSLPISGSPRMATSDPHNLRTPSLGELHQELENEQEFQVNRLLQEIRHVQIQAQRRPSGHSLALMTGDDVCEHDISIAGPGSAVMSAPALSSSGPHSPSYPHTSFDIARADLQRHSRTPSRGASPRLRATSISGEGGEHWHLGGRNEIAFCQAETHMLIRENKMLRRRIRDLERQLIDSTNTMVTARATHEPSHIR